MRSLKRSLLLATVVAVFAAACGGATESTLATVNGTEIELDEVRALRVSYGGEEVEVNSEGFRVDLSRVIFAEVLVEAAARPEYGIEITDADIDARLAAPPPRYAPGFAGIAADDDLTDEALRLQATFSLLEDRVTTKLLQTEEGYLAGILQDQPEQLASACVRHILVEDLFTAGSIVDQLADGADFAALAAEFSIDDTNAQTGGILATSPDDCVLPLSRWVPEFGHAAATGEIGAILGPVQTQFGYHVIRVDERTDLPTLEQLESDPLAYVGDVEYSRVFSPWLSDELRTADITVSPLVGSWFAEGLGILPPDA